MIRVRSKNVLLVAPDTFSVDLLPNNKLFRHIFTVGCIFPTIHEQQPNLIIFDYDYLANDIEKILRRMGANPAYNKIKVCCYKSKAHTKTDSLLKALGVDHIFYPEDFKKPAESKSLTSVISGIFDASLTSLLAKVSH
ncbi:hypothetical protein [Mucilaginibacter sp. SP1R1]|uniref:hypothetical protein n=1 Tax=Mucilaginibacter sp. SP1R1 TaxID=2723091 RepID=UPI0016081F7B|nr:hypothetical protein [Mucilaginibacter sp. SP1R1]MBB6150070.1 hypothetical protein [Mucilaginibacter sp. SP1R1]